MAGPARLRTFDINAVAKVPTDAIAEITEKCADWEITSTPAETNTPKVKNMDPPCSQIPDSPTQTMQTVQMVQTMQPRPASRPTSATNPGLPSRSASRSTARSRPASRHGSLHSPRRPTVSPSIVTVPARSSQPVDHRESLLALHRESCRLFQDPASAAIVDSRLASTYKPRRESSHSSDVSAPPFPGGFFSVELYCRL
ncbi:hypothetical protein N7468_005958 [Penicillium chermesinum]|uniref:Uncharacterized protein n=1 Tax=Penicillium chermesinum TaxID=63820 RepID=A0A9W9TNR0_9EURO|nr:uncharacterized protein N7468_005958 [Penicillium chermesinum]KAJ5233002.1 hypothetical protein N7468_005958 [Penicillium chermesinum]